MDHFTVSLENTSSDTSHQFTITSKERTLLLDALHQAYDKDAVLMSRADFSVQITRREME